MPTVDDFLCSLFSGGPNSLFLRSQFLPVRLERQDLILLFEQRLKARMSLKIVGKR
jgi:hypothetical protein